MMRVLLPLPLLFGAAAGATVRVSCLGDSITVGACGTKLGYPAMLQAILGSGYEVTNFGNSGKTMLTNGLCDDGGNCSYVSTPSWGQALASTPDIATIMFGTNDAKQFNWFGVQEKMADSYFLDYIDKIRQLQQLKPQPKIFVLSLVPLYKPGFVQMNDTVINVLLSSKGGLLSQLATLQGVGFIDVHDAFVSGGYGPNITCDGCHPIDVGYELIAQTLAKHIRAAMGDDRLSAPIERYDSPELLQMAGRVNRFVPREQRAQPQATAVVV